MYYMKTLKSPTHIHFFDEKFYRFETVFCIMTLGFSPCFMCVLCKAKILPQIYTRIIASLKPPPIYAHYTRGKFRPDIYEKSRRVWNRWAIDWASASLRSFVSRFVYAVIVWIRSFLFLIGWCQSLVVKVWWDCINSL